MPSRLRAVLATVTVAALLVAAACDDGASDATATPATATPDTSPTAGSTVSTTPTASPTGSPTATASPTTTPEATPSGTPGGNPDGEPTADDAVDVLVAYFAAIDDGDYEVAYAFWRDGGAASGQTYEEFVAGFAETASVTWEIGEPGRIDPGAGQRFIDIPVVLNAITTGGEHQRFEGSYVLHHTADIEGATPEQRVWRIHSATRMEVAD